MAQEVHATSREEKIMARGSLKPRGKGIWTIVIDLPRGDDGRRRQKRFTVHGKKVSWAGTSAR
jgi:hypothetical protein